MLELAFARLIRTSWYRSLRGFTILIVNTYLRFTYMGQHHHPNSNFPSPDIHFPTSHSRVKLKIKLRRIQNESAKLCFLYLAWEEKGGSSCGHVVGRILISTPFL
jgi:hypothetical protein